MKIKHNENKITSNYHLNFYLNLFQIESYSEVLHLDIFSYLTTQLQATVVI